MSIPRRIAIGVALLLSALVLAACQPAREGGGSGTAVDGRVAGKVGGEDISVAELDANIKEELFRRASRGGKESDVYKLRQREFQRMANDLVLETEAAAQGMEPEELMTRESSRDIQVSEVQIQALYDANKGQFQGKGFDEVAPLIRNHLERQERQANAGRFLAGLRDRNQVEFVLERVRVDVVGGGPVLGSADAPVTIVEFSDYQCPYCKHAESIVSEVRNRYPDRVRFEFRHFPLEDIHPRARAAAEAATCAETQERFWEYHELVFASAAEDLSDGTLREHAGAAGLDLDAFDACVAERSGRSRVDRDLDVGREAGVDGTPTFFVNGIAITGGASADDFAKLIDEELERLRAGG